MPAFAMRMAAAISGLPEREKMVLSLYYDEDMNLREIGEVLEVSESQGLPDSRPGAGALARAPGGMAAAELAHGHI